MDFKSYEYQGQYIRNYIRGNPDAVIRARKKYAEKPESKAKANANARAKFHFMKAVREMNAIQIFEELPGEGWQASPQI